MPVKFEALTHASVLMLDDNAEDLLKVMQLNPDKPGALRPEDIPAVLEKLEMHVETESRLENAAQSQSEDREESSVAIRARAKPLVELMKHCISSEELLQWSKV